MKGSESVHLRGTDISTVNQVKDLKEDERVEYKGEVGHLILASRCVFDSLGGIGVSVADHRLASIHNDHHDRDHVKADSKDLAVHVGCHNVALSASVVSDIGRGTCRGQS